MNANKNYTFLYAFREAIMRQLEVTYVRETDF